MKILVLNSGSSSQKSSLYEIGDALPQHPPEPIWQAKAEWNGDQAEVTIETSHGAQRKQQTKIASREQALEPLLDTLWTGETQVVSSPSEINVVGHRVVNGGQDFRQPTIITPDVKAAISHMSAFAPLHNRAELEGMEIVAKRL